jgi:hypothetical protein
MQGRTTTDWPRILAEGVAIVASILLAFGIDAWWQDRQTRQEEQQVLQGLKAEFTSIREVLEEHLDIHMQGLQSLEKLLIAIEHGASGEDGSIVESAVEDLLAPTTSDIGNGTLDALLSSGRVEILSNRTLRARLAAWNGVIGEVWDDQVVHSKLVYEVFVPYFISESIPAGITMRYWYDDWPIPGTPISEDPAAMKQLLEDSRFRVMVEIRYGYKRHLTEEFHLAIAAAEEILLEIDKSIN